MLIHLAIWHTLWALPSLLFIVTNYLGIITETIKSASALKFKSCADSWDVILKKVSILLIKNHIKSQTSKTKVKVHPQKIGLLKADSPTPPICPVLFRHLPAAQARSGALLLAKLGPQDVGGIPLCCSSAFFQPEYILQKMSCSSQHFSRWCHEVQTDSSSATY